MYHQAVFDEPIITEKRGRRTLKLPFEEKSYELNIPKGFERDSLNIGDREEFTVIRHFVRLSEMNYGVDSGFYPLGSCTMKYNPKVADEIASLDGFRMIHPLQDPSEVQGALKIMYELGEFLKRITGMDEITLEPLAGAEGEFTGLSIVRKYFECKGELDKRREVVVPDSAHGSNPASSTMAGFDVIEIPSLPDGTVDMDAFKSAVTNKTAAFMITNPNTLGIFDDKILDIANYAHSQGALLYYDGANLNGIITKTTPAKMGFDIVHLNLHKTFSTPHGGGGPGAGPVAVVEKLKDFLPYPLIRYDGKYHADYVPPKTIGKVASFYGNFLVLVRAWVYIKLMGEDGLRDSCETAVVNSNYMSKKMSEFMPVPGKKLKKHEFVASVTGQNMPTAGEVAKHLIDSGIHAPTIYFPLIVKEALMIEPTESATKEEMDAFIEKVREALNTPHEILDREPRNLKVTKIDDVDASRNPRPTLRMARKVSAETQ
ncbi:MAG: aminomethyl-transferring glycine dehydrogenase subunit GcvPB [Thermoplasmatales archaeon]